MHAAEPLRVLLVEDNAADADLAREHLCDLQDAPLDLVHVTTLREAVERLHGPLPDAIILDLTLPDCAGLATYQQIRLLSPDVPILVLAGELTETMRQQILSAGATDCLGKSPPPFEILHRGLRLSTALRRAEGQQRQMERLVGASPDAVFVADAAGVVRFVNQSALELFGKRREDFVGELLTFAVEPGKVAELEVLRGTERRTAEMRSVDVEWEGHAAVMVNIRDTTDSQRLSEQLLQAQKMEAVGHLAGGVAHDFNNLITVILAYGSSIKDTLQEDDPRREDLSQIMAAADRAKSLTRQLLAFARRQPIQVQSVQFDTLAEGIQQLLRRTLPEHTTLHVHCAPDIWPVLADPGQLEQVLINLAVNASDAMPRGGLITVSVENIGRTEHEAGWEGGDAIRVQMRDSGEGIPAEHLRRIFDPFFTTKAPGKGTGLGLATCYGIVQQAGGTITVASTLGEGTTFTIMLPRAVGEAPPRQEPRRALMERLDGHETIVLVEDDDSLRRSIVRVLRRYGYAVLTATNGEEGQHLIEGYDGVVDLIITDLIMPKMGGGALVDFLRRTRPSARVLCMTGYAARPGDPTTGLREGVEVLYKPFEPTELLRRIREMLTPVG